MDEGRAHGGTVTVVVPAYEAASTVAAAISSALASPLVAQCLVIDDASRDGTSTAAERAAAGDARVELVRRHERGGPARARNDGLERTRCPRVCFLDADDALLDGGLEALADALAANKRAVVAIGRFRAVDAAGEPVDVGSWAKQQLRPVVRRAAAMVESPDGVVPEALVARLISPPPGAWLVDVGTARALGGFDEGTRRSEDLEFLVRLASSGAVAVTDREVLAYRRHHSQRSAAHARRRWGRGRTLWRMLRAAPGAGPTLALARGMAAYHLELFAVRRRGPSLGVRTMALRNLSLAGLVRLEGVAAAALPRRVLRPLAPVPSVAVD